MIESKVENGMIKTAVPDKITILSTSSVTSSQSVQELEQLFSRSEVRLLLIALQQKQIEKVKPVLNDVGAIVYPEASRLTPAGPSQISAALEDLARADILKKEPSSPAFNCPECNIEIPLQALVCPNCHGTDLLSGSALQHLPCLNFDFEFNFEHRDGSVYCPKCEKKLLDPGSDYLQPGTFFKCVSCGEFTTRALRLYTCSNCQRVYESSRKAAVQAFEYRLNNEKIDSVSRYLGVSEPITSFVKHQGMEDRKFTGETRVNNRTKRVRRKLPRKRTSFDIMADILTIVTVPSSKTEIMACANLSFDQCRKYLPALERLGLVTEYLEDGIHARYSITDKGREYLSNMSAEFGSIAEGDKSVWITRRRASDTN